MKYFALILILFAGRAAFPQTRAELEARRKQTLADIEYVDNMLKATVREKTQGINDLKMISNRIGMRESVIAGLRSEIELIDYRIKLNEFSIGMMEESLEKLRKEYAANIRSAFKASKGYHPAIFILSARDFNQGYKRMKYIQQTAKFRRRQAEVIVELVNVIGDTKRKLERDIRELNELRFREESQKRQLETEQQRKQRLIKELTGKEKQLQQELENKRKTAARIQSEINRLIEEEKKKAAASDLTPEQRITGTDFAGNKGKLPWPVERGVITSGFGKQQLMKNVVFDNPGIEITSSGRTNVRSVFRGEVARVFAIQGGNMAVIIRHGKYMTVYQNLVNVTVKPGEKVETKQVIGELFIAEPDNKGVLSFMVYEETVKLNPEQWLAAKNQ